MLLSPARTVVVCPGCEPYPTVRRVPPACTA